MSYAARAADVAALERALAEGGAAVARDADACRAALSTHLPKDPTFVEAVAAAAAAGLPTALEQHPDEGGRIRALDSTAARVEEATGCGPALARRAAATWAALQDRADGAAFLQIIAAPAMLPSAPATAPVVVSGRSSTRERAGLLSDVVVLRAGLAGLAVLAVVVIAGVGVAGRGAAGGVVAAAPVAVASTASAAATASAPPIAASGLGSAATSRQPAGRAPARSLGSLLAAAAAGSSGSSGTGLVSSRTVIPPVTGAAEPTGAESHADAHGHADADDRPDGADGADAHGHPDAHDRPDEAQPDAEPDPRAERDARTHRADADRSAEHRDSRAAAFSPADGDDPGVRESDADQGPGPGVARAEHERFSPASVRDPGPVQDDPPLTEPRCYEAAPSRRASTAWCTRRAASSADCGTSTDSASR